jgi:IS30 family transposase
MQETELAVQETQELLLAIPTILDSAPEILMRNQASFDKALYVFTQLETLIKEQGMNEIYDSQLTKFVNQCQITINSMNERRAPVTQLLTKIGKQYTTLEAEVKELKDKGQTYRNDYATKIMKERQEEERLKQLQLEKEKELISFRQSVSILYGEAFSALISEVKKEKWDWFNALTLDVAKTPETKKSINEIECHLKDESLTIDTKNIFTRFLSDEEKQSIISEVKTENLPAYKDDYEADMMVLRQDMGDTLPSKIKELETLALADEEESKRLLEAQKKREEEAAAKLLAEQAKRNEDAAAAANVIAAGQTASATVEASLFTEAPKVAESYEIKLSNNANYLMLVQFWFEKEGKTLTSEKLEAFTIKRIKSFCEAYAVKNGEFVKGVGVVYEPKYKAK